MGTIAVQRMQTPHDASGCKLFKWAGLANGDDGEPVSIPGYADKSIQVIGTFGAGGNLRVEGSNISESPTWATLVDPQGNELNFTAAKIEQVLEGVYQIRPIVTAGDGTTDLEVHLLCVGG